MKNSLDPELNLTRQDIIDYESDSTQGTADSAGSYKKRSLIS